MPRGGIRKSKKRQKREMKKVHLRGGRKVSRY